MQPHITAATAAARADAATSAAVAAASSTVAAAAPSLSSAAAPVAAWSTEEPEWTSHRTDRILQGQLERFRHLRAAHAPKAAAAAGTTATAAASAASVQFEPTVAATPEGLRDLSARTLDSILGAPLSSAGLLAVVSPPPMRSLCSAPPHDFLSPPALSVVVALDSANLSTLGDAVWNRAVRLLFVRWNPQCSGGERRAALTRLGSNNLLYTLAQRAGLSRLCYATLHTHYTSNGTRALSPSAASHLQSWSNRMTLLRPMSDSVLSDTMESLVGMIMLERGVSAATHFVECVLGTNLLRDPHSLPMADIRSKNTGTRPIQFRPNSVLPKPITLAKARTAGETMTGTATVAATVLAAEGATAASDEHSGHNS